MKTIFFVISVLAVTAYLAVTAWEDYKTCEVTRWKHLIGLFPVVAMFLTNVNLHSMEENVLVLFFAAIYVVIGFAGVYGLADGLVLANLTLFFGSIGGLSGSGAVLLIMVIAAFSFLFCHTVTCVVKHRKVFRNMAGALVPHILVGYGVVVIIMILKKI